MTRKELEEVLNNVKKLRNSIKAISYRIDDIYQCGLYASSVQGIKDLQKYIKVLDDTLKLYSGALLTYELLINEHMGDTLEADVIKMRYLSGMEWEEIAFCLGYTKRRLYDIRNRGLDTLSCKLDYICIA